MNMPGKDAGDHGTVLAEHRTDLALHRTIIAADRTLMAWIRTAISMIGFGFTMIKFFQYLPGEVTVGTIRRPNAPRNLGLTLIALGTLALCGAIWQYQIFLKNIEAPKSKYLWSISISVAVAVVLIGMLAFAGILLRQGPF
jgi:putative membrane protein